MFILEEYYIELAFLSFESTLKVLYQLWTQPNLVIKLQTLSTEAKTKVQENNKRRIKISSNKEILITHKTNITFKFARVDSIITNIIISNQL